MAMRNIKYKTVYECLVACQCQEFAKCINYFSIAMINCHSKSTLEEKGVNSALLFSKDRIQGGRGGTVAGVRGQHNSGGRNIR